MGKPGITRVAQDPDCIYNCINEQKTKCSKVGSQKVCNFCDERPFSQEIGFKTSNYLVTSVVMVGDHDNSLYTIPMNYKLQRISNGLRVMVVPMPSLESVTVTVWVKTGSRNEDQEVDGISHFLEHMVFKGSTKRPTAKDITRSGGLIWGRVQRRDE